MQVEPADLHVFGQIDGSLHRQKSVTETQKTHLGFLFGLTSFLLLCEACECMHDNQMRMNSSLSQASIYHVSGLDDRDRGFNRQVHVIPCEGGFQARLRYELLQVEVDPVPMEEHALQRLIHVLHDRGYRQLRTQRIFIGDQYLGNQEIWVEYSDPDSSSNPTKTWWMWLRQIFRLSPPS